LRVRPSHTGVSIGSPKGWPLFGTTTDENRQLATLDGSAAGSEVAPATKLQTHGFSSHFSPTAQRDRVTKAEAGQWHPNCSATG
jgi:hypothetical protein